MIQMPDGTTVSVRQYLLGTLPDADAQTLEHRYLNQPELLESIATYEEELIEDFLDGRLDRVDRRAFEQFYLASPVHRQRVAVIAGLRKRAADAASRATPGAKVITGPWFQHPIIRLATAALLVLGIVTLMRLVSRPVDGPQVARVAPPAPAPPAAPSPGPSTEPPAPPTVPPAPLVVAVTLPSLITRGTGQPTVTIPADAERVSIRLEGEPPASTRPLTAAIRTVEGRQVWTGPATRGTSGISAVLDVPATVLAADDYLISLSDGSELATFAFRVARR